MPRNAPTADVPPCAHSIGMEAEVEVEGNVLATAGDFLVYLCCCGADSMWVERVSTGKASDMPKAETEAILQLPEDQRPAALERLWHEHV